MQSKSISTLRQLANVITEAVDTMEREYARSDVDLPSLEATFNADDPAEALRQNPMVSVAIMDLMAAASQIAATVCNPVTAALNAAQAVRLLEG
jgi:outer membrane protein TolC